MSARFIDDVNIPTAMDATVLMDLLIPENPSLLPAALHMVSILSRRRNA